MTHEFFGQGGPWDVLRRFGRRRFKRGVLRWIVLAILAEGERHGYDFIKLFRERWGGPGAGSIYPILAMLEEQGLIAGRDVDGKRVYVITDKGREVLARGPRFDLGAMFAESAEESSLQQAIKKLMAACAQARDAAPEIRDRTIEILNRARKEIYTVLANE
ncbi:MAG TPA: PadR family transcriptional regulator [Candidatus Rubrimentiphilum sp.]|nr:PadR family transcriptional regulator [Candidatus Rubrimentiphilum sp.]